MKKIGVIANCRKEHAPDVLRKLRAKAQTLGLELLADADTAALLGDCRIIPAGKLPGQADVVMALGGDGTMLRVVRELNGAELPVLGVNIGALGFLTSVAETELETALECLAEGRVRIVDRALVECVVSHNNAEIASFVGLNEVLIGNSKSARVATLDVTIDGEKVTSYVCDGLIVSTPTGSTGHSLSAGGPIVMPDTRVLVVSVICPHTLSSRPLVIPDSGSLVVTAAKSEGELLLTVDGQVSCPVVPGDSVRIIRGRKNALFAHLPGYSYFSVLRHKLHWRGSAV